METKQILETIRMVEEENLEYPDDHNGYFIVGLYRCQHRKDLSKYL